MQTKKWTLLLALLPVFAAQAANSPRRVSLVTTASAVVGTTASQVQVVIRKLIHAESQSSLDKAKKEVTLQAVRDDNSVRLYVDGPFRCHGDRGDDLAVVNGTPGRAGQSDPIAVELGDFWDDDL